MTGTLSDLEVALRSFARAPLETVVGVVTVALGMGAVTTLFSVVDAVWLESLPYPEPDRLAAIKQRDVHEQAVGMSYLNFTDLRGQARSLARLSAFCFPFKGSRSRPESCPESW